MPSTFNGLEVAKRALHTQQSALYTTGHNIANANTEGYTRQRVNMTQTDAYPAPGRNRPEIPGQIGAGVEAGSIQRIRDSFVDKQFRQENNKVGYYESKAEMMSQMEAIMNEPTDEGLSNTMDKFWESLQDLSVNPEDAGARSVVRQRGIAVTEAFQYAHNSLQDVRSNLKNEIGVDNTEVNSLIDQINGVNRQISEIEPHGHVPNDLYDERDRLIDDLSEYVDISVDYRKSSGQPSSIAEGIATITLNADANDIDGGDTITLVDGSGDVEIGSDDAVNHIYVGFDDDNNAEQFFFTSPDRDRDTEDVVNDLMDGSITPDQQISAHSYEVQGKLKALMEGVGYVTNEFDDDGNPIVAGEFNNMLADLDEMVENLVNEFNAVHQQGFALNGENGFDFFDPNGVSAATMAVHDDILDDKDNIAASNSADGVSGNGENAIDLAEVYTKRAEEYETTDFEPTLGDKTSLKSFFESTIGEMGVIAEEANRMSSNSGILRNQVEENRQSISSVSLDEEMSNLIQFQHAYNAAARNMTAVDEMLDRIINNMGLVGR
ncbi:flagellar hook-associated protein FlgK [Gracilibacillus salitolerans]|uniref:Flagellar hook-associated protein 1 n=1 Tax=Gracilibacillus salitolerans TaxID=2663022 RepID=A0A5Q2TLA6_9BACI|nr:flagellar hook-associated protein FlgK [Gracilibacillus salitolerans]QGH34048.1 flagellar hook-associated protein FlgK [Gracilibacillus salitolerans]